jgi:hypothetical protein
LPHRLRVIAEVVEGFPQAELNAGARHCVKARPLGEAMHAIHQRPVGPREALDSAQFLKGGREFFDCQGQVLDGLLEHPADRQQLAQESPRLGRLRGQSEQAAKFFLRFVRFALHVQHLCRIEPAGQRVFGPSAQLAKDDQGFG